MTTTVDLDEIILDDGVGQQLGAHFLDPGLGLVGIGVVEVELDVFALAHLVHAGEAERLQGPGDGLALGVQDAFLEGDVNACQHSFVPPWTAIASPSGPGSRGARTRA
jgi:hypothetical protein